MFNRVCRRLVWLGLVWCHVTVAVADGPADVKAFCRDGQTFITWKEDPSARGEWYKVYAGEQPITAETLQKATLVAKVPKGSNRFGFFRNVDATKGFFQKLSEEPWAKAIQIEDDEAGGKQLADGTGLLVRTVKNDGSTYYAVTLEQDGKERLEVTPGVSSLKEPVAEKVAPLGAVLQRKLGDRHFMFAIFCDYDLWNPDGVDDNWDGYVHVFQIRAPAADAKGTKEPYPVSFRLHAFGAWGDWQIGYCYPATHVDVRMLDYHLTWWYGYNDNLPRLDEKKQLAKGTVVNFTERRVLQVARWLMGGPRNFPFKVDPAQLSIFGGSMGGTGTHYVGGRNGDVFAGAFADEGIFDWSLRPPFNNWTGDVLRKFGPQDRNDPTNEGLPVYDVLNLPRQMAEYPGREVPFLSIGQGMIDFVIPFHGLVDYMKALEKGKHPYAGGWEMAGHSPWVGSGSPMDYKLIRRDEPVPAFANASCNTALRSGFRIVTSVEEFTENGLRIKAGQLKDNPYAKDGGFPDLAGKTLVIYPSGANRDAFAINGSTATELTVEKGNLAEYLPPITSWDIHVRKQEIKTKEGKDRELSDEEKKAMAQARKKSILICDGQPRGTWNGQFAWSTRNQNFDPAKPGDDTIDQEKKLAICIRLARNSFAGEPPETATTDVTPRRCREFKAKAGEQVHWENWDCSDPASPKKIAEGDVVADAHGLVTVEKFTIGKKGWGNQILLTRK